MQNLVPDSDTLVFEGYIGPLAERLIEHEADAYSPSPLETHEGYIRRRKAAFTDSLRRTFKQASMGYKLLLRELAADKTRDITPFLIDKNSIASFDPTKPLLLYEVFGWDKTILRTLYSQANSLFERKCYADATDAYSFLTTVSPLMAEFWKALSVAYEADNKPQEAQEAAGLAHYLEGKNGTS